jgi:hypothetical protein
VPEGGEALFQSQSVGRADSEYSNAALRAACPAQEVRPAAFRGIGEGAINKRHESAVLALEMRLGMIRVEYGMGTHGPIVGQMLSVGPMQLVAYAGSNVAWEGKRRL